MPRRWTFRTTLVVGVATCLVICLAVASVLLIEHPPSVPPQPQITPTFDHYAAYTRHRQRGQWQQALYHLQRVADQGGWSAVRHVEMGDLWRNMGDLSQALTHWVASADDQLDLLRQIAATQLNQADYGAAQATLTRLLTVNPQDAWGNYHLGLLLAPSDPIAAQRHLQGALANATYQEAARRVLSVLMLYADDPLLSAHVGATLADLRAYGFAERAFLYASGYNYPFAEALAYAGLMQDLQGKDGEAVIRQAIALAPGSADVRYAQGLHLRIQGNHEGSLRVLRAALMLEPDNPIYYVAMGQTYQAMGNVTQARPWFEAAVEVSGDVAQIEAVRDRFYADEAALLPEEVLEQLLQPADAQADNPEALTALGYALHSTGETEAGLEQIQRALALAPDNPRVLFDLARVLLETGDLDAATPILERLAAGDSAYATSAAQLLRGVR